MKALALTFVLVSTTLAIAHADTPSTTPVDVVRAYIDARNRHDASAAYALLSTTDNQKVKLADLHQSAKALGWASAPDSPLASSYAFIYDIAGTTGLRFRILGPEPNSDGVVLVVDRPGHRDFTPYEIPIATETDPTTGRRTLDANSTLAYANPNVFTDARDKARAISCMSNMKMMGLAILEYEQDHDENMPDADKWMDEIKPYIDGPDEQNHTDSYNDMSHVMRCPSDSTDHAYSYSYNRQLSHVSLAQLQDPADTVMVFESSQHHRNQSDYGSSLQIPSRHRGGDNYLFADGHARRYSDLDHPSIKLDRNFNPIGKLAR